MHATRDTAAFIYNHRCGRARDARRYADYEVSKLEIIFECGE
jgi:hypothetical protein